MSTRLLPSTPGYTVVFLAGLVCGALGLLAGSVLLGHFLAVRVQHWVLGGL